MLTANATASAAAAAADAAVLLLLFLLLLCLSISGHQLSELLLLYNLTLKPQTLSTPGRSVILRHLHDLLLLAHQPLSRYNLSSFFPS